MNKVEISNPFMVVFAMQVCAEKDATDEEILEVCNQKNPSGTENGWTTVARANDEFWGEVAPVQCADNPERLHFMVFC